MRESAFDKGRRYLTEGRLVITHINRNQIDAFCRGDGTTYRLGHRDDWWCECPALTRECSHLRALRLVTTVTLRKR